MIEMRRRNPNSISGLLIILCGVVVLVYSNYFIGKYNEMNDKINTCTVEVQAPINKVNSYDNYDHDEVIYEVFFTYELNGKEYNGSDKDENEYKVGDTYHIFCNPDDPNEWITWNEANSQDNSMSFILEFVTVGIGCIAVGIVITIFKVIRRKHNR